MKPLHAFLDSLAVFISALCALHCLALPVLLLLFPLLIGSVLTEEDFHRLVLWVILPTSVIAVAAARYRHKDLRVLIWVGSGMVLLLLAAFWAHDHAPGWVDVSLTTLGGLILAIGHIRNLRLSRHHA
ncbi:MAG: MerC domain-containing protein [Gammaproteobacteria bacterium]